jgi:universal stress protein A
MNTEILEPVETAPPVTAAVPAEEKIVELVPSFLRIKNILVPLDFSEMSLKSLQYAVPFAKQFDAKLTLVHVVEAPAHSADTSFPASVSRDKLAVIEKQIDDMIPPDVSVDTAVRQSVPIDGILEVANEIQADLIITTTRGYTGLAQLFKGATVSNIVNRSPCPVLVVRENEHSFV